MDFTCPKCKSGDVRSLSILHREGVSRIDTTTQTTGLGLARGGLAIGAASGRTKGVQQTMLSQESAPPQEKTFGGVALFAVVLAIFVLFQLSNFSVLTAFLIGVIALIVWYIRVAMQWNERVYPGLRARWEKSYRCMRCDTPFVIP